MRWRRSSAYALAAAFDWRIALACMGVAGPLVLGLLATQRVHLDSQKAADAHTHTLKGSLVLFMQPAIALCFGYFVVQTTASVGLQTFLPSALNAGLSVPLVLGHLGGDRVSARRHGRHRVGGFLAARTSRHDRVAMSGLLAGAALLVVVALGVGADDDDRAAIRARRIRASAPPVRRAT